MINQIKMIYEFKHERVNKSDVFESKIDLNFPVALEEIIFFVKAFLNRLNIIPSDQLDKHITVSESNEFEEFTSDNAGIEVYKDLLKSKDADIKKMVEDENSLDSFRKQLNENQELLREVFEIFLNDTLK